MSDLFLDQDSDQQSHSSKSAGDLRFCPDCGYETYDSACPHCGSGTVDDVGTDSASADQEKYSQKLDDDFNDNLSDEKILEEDLDQYDKYSDE